MGNSEFGHDAGDVSGLDLHPHFDDPLQNPTCRNVRGHLATADHGYPCEHCRRREHHPGDTATATRTPAANTIQNANVLSGLAISWAASRR